MAIQQPSTCSPVRSTNETAGTSVQAEPLSDYIMDILQHGGIKPLIRARLGKGAL